MLVNGTAFLARKALLESDHGPDRVREFLGEFTATRPSFPEPILPFTRITIEDFLAFNDAIVRDLYDGDTLSYWRFGRQSGEWALKQGPCRRFLANKNLAEFVDTAPALYRSYFDAGSARAAIESPTSVSIWIEDVPSAHHHLYLEYAIVGYFARGLELVACAEVSHTRILGFSSDDDHVHYRYAIGRAL